MSDDDNDGDFMSDGGLDDGDGDFFDDSVLDEGDSEFTWTDEKPKQAPKAAQVMDNEQIIRKQREEVKEVATVLSVTEDEGEKN